MKQFYGDFVKREEWIEKSLQQEPLLQTFN
jgi:hypothetical protein